VFEIEPGKTGLAPEDLLRYFYYAATVQIGLKNFARALDCLQLCITAPASVLSAIVVAAHRKFILISLIERGQVGARLPFAAVYGF
jgi:COP9 signalosome complex subunit 3